MNCRFVLSMFVLIIVALALATGACGGDPYSGTWKSPGSSTSGSSPLDVTIQRANSGWWSIKLADKTFYGVDMDGMLQTGNGDMTFTPSGDKLSAVFSPDTPAVELTRQ